jgi:Domain of unknown function (DUF4383)
MAKTISLILGIVFLVVGVIGFVMPGFAGAHLSVAHNLIHLITGAVAVYFGTKGTLASARTFCLVFGLVYGLLGIAGFLLGTGSSKMLTLVPGALMLGIVDHVIHVALGTIFVLGALMTHPIHRPAT